MFKKAIAEIAVYTMFIIILVSSLIVFALLLVRMFTLQAECGNLQQICTLQIVSFCAEWYGEDEAFSEDPNEFYKNYAWVCEKDKMDPSVEKCGNEKDLSCIMKAGKTKKLKFCYVYNGTVPNKETCEQWADHKCRAVEWDGKIDCYCKPYKEFCEGLVKKT